MYGLDGSFGQLVAFVVGLNAGNDSKLLTGFRESLVVRFDDGDNLSWPALVLRLAFPDETGAALHSRLVEPDRNRHAVETLFRLLDEFLARRATHDGTLELFKEYLTWSQARQAARRAARSCTASDGD
jgi:hypothetical protein